jgi:hypothetical protein
MVGAKGLHKILLFLFPVQIFSGRRHNLFNLLKFCLFVDRRLGAF